MAEAKFDDDQSLLDFNLPFGYEEEITNNPKYRGSYLAKLQRGLKKMS